MWIKKVILDLPHSGIMRTKATKAYKANAATECLHSGMVEPKLRTPKASTCQVLSDLPSVEDDATTKVILERVILGARRRGDGIQSGVHQGP